MKKQKHICITGMDGCGKSTLIKNMAKTLPSCHIANIWDLLESPVTGLPFKTKKDIDHFLCGLTPDSRLLFLAHAMKYSIDMALQSDRELVLSDGYYFKYFASEKALGANADLINCLSRSFPAPDVIIFLELSPETAMERKCAFSRYECGLSDNPCEDSFLGFQKKAKKAWSMFSGENWHVVSSSRTTDETFNSVMEILD